MAAFKGRQPEGFFYPGAPKSKSCQIRANAPTGYTIYCLMFLCLQFLHLGSVDIHSGGWQGKGVQLGEQRRGEAGVLALRGDWPGIQSRAWYLVGPLAPASLLAASVVMLHELEVAERMEWWLHPLSSSHPLRPCTSLLPISPPEQFIPLIYFECVIWCLSTRKEYWYFSVQTAGVLD